MAAPSSHDHGEPYRKAAHRARPAANLGIIRGENGQTPTRTGAATTLCTAPNDGRTGIADTRPMAGPTRSPTEPWQRLADEQSGVISRRQLLEIGLTRDQARRHLVSRRWQILRPGVYATHTGPITEAAAHTAALLYAGNGAALSHATALWWDGVVDERPAVIHLSIPAQRQVVPADGLRIHRARELPVKVHPAASPTRTRLEHSVLDHVEGAGEEVVVDVITRSVQRRLTTAPRLRLALADRSRHAHRALIAQVLADVDKGVQSPLERRYFRDVERAHGLPRGTRNQVERTASGNRYRDVLYRRWSVVVELDGRAAHPHEGAFRDMHRDNGLTVAGDAVLRFGWRDVVGRPCLAAAQVAQALRQRGWAGLPRPCGPSCAIR